MAGNQKDRVDAAGAMLTGPVPAGGLLEAVKAEIKKEPVLKKLFGDNAERVFISERPNINESILPALLLAWKSESIVSAHAYFDGAIDAWILLPVKLTGDYNALRNVGSIFQRWMLGPMRLFSLVPGLIQFGVNATFNYEGNASFDGITTPVIPISIPYRVDLVKLRQMTGSDPFAPLDEADVGYIEAILLEVRNAETKSVLMPEGVLVENSENG